MNVASAASVLSWPVHVHVGKQHDIALRAPTTLPFLPHPIPPPKRNAIHWTQINRTHETFNSDNIRLSASGVGGQDASLPTLCASYRVLSVLTPAAPALLVTRTVTLNASRQLALDGQKSPGWHRTAS